MKTQKRPVALMTLAQIICVLVALVTLFFTLTPTVMLVSYIQQATLYQADNTVSVVLFSSLRCLRDLILGLCLICAEMEAIGVCGRMKKASAFSEKNAAGLGRIAGALMLAGLLTLLFGDSIVPFLLSNLPGVLPAVERLLMPFMLFGVALMIRAVQVLMRRAMSMQEESDLTV